MQLRHTSAAIQSSLQVSPRGLEWGVGHLRAPCPQLAIVRPHPPVLVSSNWRHIPRWTLMRQINDISPRITGITIHPLLYTAFLLFKNRRSQPNPSTSQQYLNHPFTLLARNLHNFITYLRLDRGPCQPFSTGRVSHGDHINLPLIRSMVRHDPPRRFFTTWLCHISFVIMYPPCSYLSHSFQIWKRVIVFISRLICWKHLCPWNASHSGSRLAS